MSWKIQSLIWPIELPTAEKMTLLCLGNYCADDGSNAFPSLETMASQTGMSVDTVRRALKSLTKQGIIEVERKSTNRRPTTYAITFRGSTMPPQERLGVALTPSRGSTEPPLGVAPCYPNHYESFKEPAKAISKNGSSTIPPEVRELLSEIRKRPKVGWTASVAP